MDIKRIGSQPSGKGPAEYFAGTVRINPLNSPRNPPAWPWPWSRSSLTRTAWH
jgi:hypothetical protein